jgi:hypothetical protein
MYSLAFSTARQNFSRPMFERGVGTRPARATFCFGSGRASALSMAVISSSARR